MKEKKPKVESSDKRRVFEKNYIHHLIFLPHFYSIRKLQFPPGYQKQSSVLIKFNPAENVSSGYIKENS